LAVNYGHADVPLHGRGRGFESLIAHHNQADLFIAGHLANCCSDLNRLGAMLDASPNLYADIGARFAELSPMPRFVEQFFQKYQDRLCYGTDMDPAPEMYRVTFRLLETADEHFYPTYFAKYHWPMHAFALPDEVLKKLYRDNALKLFASD
jgi:predicted TIM-barrel fold metal-dependent hydrolase